MSKEGAETPNRWVRSVASITMAYNAEGTLRRQLDALLGQTATLQEIIVVDNASIDGTAAMLTAQYPQVTVLRMHDNLGAAGAWAAGLMYATTVKKYDWVWTFDDDSVPDANALEILLQGFSSLGASNPKIGMLAPLPIDRQAGRSYPPILWRNGFVRGSTSLLQQPVWMADLVIASGCMVSRELVDAIGLPRSDFFMDVFDLEYCIRARTKGYKIAVITEARLTHEIGNTREVHLSGSKRLWMNQPAWREYYISRNLIYLAWWLYPKFATKISIARYMMEHLAGVLLFSTNRLACAWKMVQGCVDGLRGRLGIRFRPDAKGSRATGMISKAVEKIQIGKA